MARYEFSRAFRAINFSYIQLLTKLAREDFEVRKIVFSDRKGLLYTYLYVYMYICVCIASQHAATIRR